MVEFDRRILQKIQKDRSIGTMLEKKCTKRQNQLICKYFLIPEKDLTSNWLKSQLEKKYFTWVQVLVCKGASLKLHLYLSILNLSMTQKPRKIPTMLQPKKSTIAWSHQHSLKLLRTSLRLYSTSSKAKDSKRIILGSLTIRVFMNHPAACAKAKMSKKAKRTLAKGSSFYLA